jgi:hypothetical protein
MGVYSFRSDDPDLEAAVEHERIQGEIMYTRSAVLLALVRDGIQLRRLKRDFLASGVYSLKQKENDDHQA